MIRYEVGTWGLGLIFGIRGSVFPKASAWALPCAILAVVMHIFMDELNVKGYNDWIQVWTGYNFILGFLLVFRTTEAYRRYWEGGTLMQQVRGEWYNAASSIVAFCSGDPASSREVEEFQHCLVRLVSMLYCAALQKVSQKRNRSGFSILDYSGMDEESIGYLAKKPEKCEIILQWIQRLIVDNMAKGIVPVPAPVVSRVFQELSRGIVNVENARKLTDFLFPYPYAQMITVMLMISWCVTPVICTTLLKSWWWSGILTFITTLTFWSIHYIAIELEMPFGEDANDLPLADMQRGLNESLWTLLDAEAQTPPKFVFHRDQHRTFTITDPAELLRRRSTSSAISAHKEVAGEESSSRSSQAQRTQGLRSPQVSAPPMPWCPVSEITLAPGPPALSREGDVPQDLEASTGIAANRTFAPVVLHAQAPPAEVPALRPTARTVPTLAPVPTVGPLVPAKLSHEGHREAVAALGRGAEGLEAAAGPTAAAGAAHPDGGCSARGSGSSAGRGGGAR